MLQRRAKAKDKKLADDARLLRAWRKWHGEQCETAVAGQYGALIAQLLDVLHELTLDDAAELVAFVSSQDWSEIDADTRLIALHEINQGIIKLRERADLVPIDDALPGKSLRAFQLIRNIVNQFPAPSGEAKPGGVTQANDGVKRSTSWQTK